MTLGEAITTVLQRVRLSTDVTAHKDQARKYLSLMAAELLPLIPPWFLDRTTTFVTTKTLTITGASGTFTSGETITGGNSGTTATVDSYDSTNGKLYVYSESGSFTASETLTGGSSGATATFSSSVTTRSYTPISGQVTNWWSAVNETHNWTISIISGDDYDLADPDRDLTHQATAIFVGGLDADTGYPVLEVWPAEADTADTIRIRYRIDIAAWTSGNDSTSMQALGITRALESALIYGAAALYLEENRQYEMAQTESGNARRAIESVRQQGRRMHGNRRFPPKGDAQDTDLVIRIGSDLVTDS